MNSLQGIWRCISWVTSGVAVRNSVAESIEVQFADWRYRIHRGGILLDDLEYTVNESASPMEMDLLQGEADECRSIGIFSCNDESLILCFSLWGQSRPTEFISLPGTEIDLKTFKREKD